MKNNQLSSILLFLLLSLFSAIIHCSTLTVNVQGGSQAAAQEFPFLVSIQYQDSASSTPEHICGGSIINSRYILTAAHCNFEDSNTVVNPSKLTIVYGTNVLSNCPSKVGTYSACQRVAVKKISNHEGYDGNNVVNDIALYELNTDLVNLPTNHIGLIPMANAALNTPHYVIGWGLTNDNNGAASNYLMKGLVPLVDDKNCNALGLDMSTGKGQLCAGSGNGIDACSGDSGGGLAMRVEIPTTPSTNSTTNSTSSTDKFWVVSGLVSYGPNGCGVSASYSNRGVYTSVAYFKNWIASKVINSKLNYYSGNGVVIGSGSGGGGSGGTNQPASANSLKSIHSCLFMLLIFSFLFL